MDLIEKYRHTAKTLLDVMNNANSTEEMVQKASASRRFVRGFIDDLNVVKNNIDLSDVRLSLPDYHIVDGQHCLVNKELSIFIQGESLKKLLICTDRQ